MVEINKCPRCGAIVNKYEFDISTKFICSNITCEFWHVYYKNKTKELIKNNLELKIKRTKVEKELIETLQYMRSKLKENKEAFGVNTSVIIFKALMARIPKNIFMSLETKKIVNKTNDFEDRIDFVIAKSKEAFENYKNN